MTSTVTYFQVVECDDEFVVGNLGDGDGGDGGDGDDDDVDEIIEDAALELMVDMHCIYPHILLPSDCSQEGEIAKNSNHIP
jgi:hypothetical protein